MDHLSSFHPFPISIPAHNPSKKESKKKRLWEQLPKGASNVVQRNYKTIGFRLQGHGPAFQTYLGCLLENYLVKFAGATFCIKFGRMSRSFFKFVKESQKWK